MNLFKKEKPKRARKISSIIKHREFYTSSDGRTVIIDERSQRFRFYDLKTKKVGGYIKTDLGKAIYDEATRKPGVIERIANYTRPLRPLAAAAVVCLTFAGFSPLPMKTKPTKVGGLSSKVETQTQIQDNEFYGPRLPQGYQIPKEERIPLASNTYCSNSSNAKNTSTSASPAPNKTPPKITPSTVYTSTNRPSASTPAQPVNQVQSSKTYLPPKPTYSPPQTNSTKQASSPNFKANTGNSNKSKSTSSQSKPSQKIKNTAQPKTNVSKSNTAQPKTNVPQPNAKRYTPYFTNINGQSQERTYSQSGNELLKPVYYDCEREARAYQHHGIPSIPETKRPKSTKPAQSNKTQTPQSNKNQTPQSNQIKTQTNITTKDDGRDVVWIPEMQLYVRKNSPRGIAFLREQAAKEGKKIPKIDYEKVKKDRHTRLSLSREAERQRNHANPINFFEVALNDADQYRLNAIDIQGSRTPKGSYNLATSEANKSADSFSKMFQPEHMTIDVNAKKAGNTIADFAWNLGVQLPYSIINIPNWLPSLEDKTFKKQPGWFRPFVYAGRTIPLAFDVATSSLDVPTAGIVGATINPFLAGVDHGLESVLQSLEGTLNLARPKNKPVNFVFDLPSTALTFGANVIRGRGFTNMTDEQKSVRDKGYFGTTLELVADGWLVGSSLERASTESNKSSLRFDQGPGGSGGGTGGGSGMIFNQGSGGAGGGILISP